MPGAAPQDAQAWTTAPLPSPRTAAAPGDGSSGPDSAGTVLTLEAPTSSPRPPEGSLRGASWRSPRRRLVAAGLVAVLVHVGIVLLALSGLSKVAQAQTDLTRIVTAQRYFQDADMAHDAINGTAARTALGVAEQRPAAVVRERARVLADDVREFRRHLRSVDSVALPAELQALVDGVRPAQNRYAERAQAMSDSVLEVPATALAQDALLEPDALELVERQAVVTEAMSDEAKRRQEILTDDRRVVRDRLIASAVVALLGLLGITALLHRMGGDLTALLARERGVAETLQHSLLPDRLPELPGLRLAARYSAGGAGAEVGGDWYDVIPLPGGRVGLVMGDVVGHDLHAASSMGQLRNALRAIAAEGAAPADVLQRLNRLCVSQDLGEMATVLYAVLDPVSGEVDVANAGHPPPLLVSADERRFLETVSCPPVGVVREAEYRSTAHALPAGSLLLLYTDGLVERRAATVDEGLCRLERLVVPRPDGDLELLCDDVLAGMMSGAPPEDDVALLLVAPQAQLGPHVDVVWPAQAERLSVLRHLLERWLTEAGATQDEVYDVLVACSEAATNAIEHAYGPGQAEFRVVCDAVDGGVTIVVRDWGQWRAARGQDRGRGLWLMEELMDEVQVLHGDSGTEVRLHRRLSGTSTSPPSDQQEVMT